MGSLRWQEFRALVDLSSPPIMSSVLVSTMHLTDQVMVGHLGAQELASSALAVAFFQMNWLFLLGVGTALDTLASQAFGAKDLGQVKQWATRTALLLTVLCVPLASTLWFSDWFLAVVLRQPSELAAMAGSFCRFMIPGVWFLAMFTVMMKYLQAQTLMRPPMYVYLAANVFNIPANYLLIYYLDWGFVGAACAWSATRIFACMALGGWVLSDAAEAQSCALVSTSFSITALQKEPALPALDGSGDAAAAVAQQTIDWADTYEQEHPHPWKELLCLAVPGGFMLALESGNMQITLLCAGYLSPISLGAHSILQTVSNVSFLCVPYGVEVAIAIRVGNLLGAQKPKRAQVASQTALFIVAIFTVAFGMVLYACRDHIGWIFSKDPSVQALVSDVLPVVVFYQIANGVHGVGIGVLRGMGKQTALAVINFIAFWLIGLPLALSLAFAHNEGVVGLWWGTTVGLSVALSVYLYLIEGTDWYKQAGLAADRRTGLTSARRRSASTVHPPQAALQPSAPSPTRLKYALLALEQALESQSEYEAWVYSDSPLSTADDHTATSSPSRSAGPVTPVRSRAVTPSSRKPVWEERAGNDNADSADEEEEELRQHFEELDREDHDHHEQGHLHESLVPAAGGLTVTVPSSSRISPPSTRSSPSTVALTSLSPLFTPPSVLRQSGTTPRRILVSGGSGFVSPRTSTQSSGSETDSLLSRITVDEGYYSTEARPTPTASKSSSVSLPFSRQ